MIGKLLMEVDALNQTTDLGRNPIKYKNFLNVKFWIF